MFKTLLILLVVAVLLEDSMSVKKTKEEEEEDERVAKEVNATLAAEEAEKKKEEEEKKKQDEKKKTKIQDESGKVKDKDEACPPLNFTCPTIRCRPCPKCPPCEVCPVANCTGVCPESPQKDCLPCDACPEEHQCPTVDPCPPCGSTNTSTVEPPSSGCPDPASMSVPEAMAVGAVATLMVTGVAASIGLLLRYASPFVSGFVFLASLILMWYFSSHYPETARELGGRAATLLREAAAALSHRVMEALRHHNNQVGFS